MDTVKKINAIFRTIAETSSNTGKEAVLKAHEGDQDVLDALDFLLNPYITTGISTRKINKKVNVDWALVPLDFGGLISYIKNNNSGKDSDIYSIQSYIEKLENDELKDFVKKFVTKTFKLGVSEKTVNKVYGKGTIPTFAVMLAESYAKKKDKVKGKFYITLKLDGNRCVAIKENGKTKFFTRKGQEIEGLNQLSQEFAHFPDNQVFDGEILLVNKDNLPSDELFRATQKVVRKDGEKTDLEFHMFDTLPLSEFRDGKSKKTYEQRRNSMEFMFMKLSQNTIGELIEPVELDFVKILPVMYVGDDQSVIPAFSSAVEEQGLEGVMINTADGLYQTKRVNDLLKVKTMKTADLLCVTIEKAIDGQFEGLLGRINVEYKGNLVGIGSGFTLEQRKYFIENPDEIIGKIIETQFFEESVDEKSGQPSLRFPVFKGIRDDKTIDDINYGE